MIIPSLQEIDSLHRNICQAFADPKRIQIMYTLYRQPRHVTAIAELLDMPQPTISRHLAILKQRGLVHSEREGAAVIYAIADIRIIEVLETMRSLLRDLLAKQASVIDA